MRLGRHLGVERAEPALAILERAPEDALDGLLREPVQDEHLRPRQQRGVHLERRVLGGGADEDDVAGFDARQERVLLRLVEAVDLVDEDDGPPAGAAPAILRRRHHLLDLLDAGEHGAERHEPRLRELGDDARQRGLAGAGRPPEDDRLEHVALDGSAQRRAGRRGCAPGRRCRRACAAACARRAACRAPARDSAGAKPSSSGSPNRLLMSEAPPRTAAAAPRRPAARRPPRR